MKNLIFVIFLHGLLATVHSCEETYNFASGSITAFLTDGDDCTYFLVPPSSEYTFVTLTFTNTTAGYEDRLSIYDGPSNTSAVINDITLQNFTTLVMSSTQPYVTIEFNTWLPDSAAGWTLTYEYSTKEPPSCAGPIYLTYYAGTVVYKINGTSSKAIECQWIFAPYNLQENWDWCDNSLQFVLNSWQDSTNSAVASIYKPDDIAIDFIGSFDNTTQIGAEYTTDVEEAASMTIGLNTFAGSVTRIEIGVGWEATCSGSSLHSVGLSLWGALALMYTSLY